jgi:hypothetical protein
MTLSPYLKLHLAPVPEVIRQNLIKYLSAVTNNGARALLYFDPLLTANLWARGAFSDLNILGVITKDSNPGGAHLSGLPVYSFGDLAPLSPDTIIVTDYRNHRKISEKLTPLSKRHGFQIIDLCSGFEKTSFRREWAEKMTRHIFSNEISDSPALQVEIWVPPQWGFGDKLCALSTAREFARRHSKHKVHFQYFPEIVTAYGDNLVVPGSGRYVIPYQEPHFYRDRNSSLAANYLGCYYLNAGLHFDDSPCLDLPSLPPHPELMPQSYIALQPLAGWANPNIARHHLESIIRMAPLPVVVVGKPETRRDIKGAIFDYLGQPIDMLRIIQHAAFMLTPRSASAHIAAAYRVPSLIWVPSDGENWHLDFPEWDHKTISVRHRGLVDWVIKEMSTLTSKRLPAGSQSKPWISEIHVAREI